MCAKSRRSGDDAPPIAHIVRSYMVIVTYGAHNGRMPLHAPTLPCA
ncbi:hypothetical protein ACVKN3_002994 [Luteibacter sp. PvP120]